MNLLVILGGLLLALMIAVPLMERYAKPVPASSAGRLSRWILPLAALLLLLQLLRHWFG